MNEALISLCVIVVFSIIGGFFASAETALVALRESQVARLSVTGGKRGAKLAGLLSNPNRFLAAVQVGVTLTGFISAGYGSSKIVPHVAPFFEGLGVNEHIAEIVSFLLVTAFITYISLVLGELVPKRIALQRTEGVALTMAGTIDALAKVLRGFIWLLSVSTNAIVRIIGLDTRASKTTMSTEELRRLVASHSGFSPAERMLIDDVFATADRELREVMIPRTEVKFLSDSTTVRRAAQKLMELPHSRYPVIHGSADQVIGFVHVRDVLDPALADSGARVETLVREVVRFPWSKKVLTALQYLRDNHAHFAIVEDEFGGTAGIVTMEDLVEELVGDIRDEYDEQERPPSADVDFAGSMQVDGLANLDEFFERTGIRLPEGPYETVAGYVMAVLGRVPQLGDSVSGPGCSLAVEELDRRRVSRIMVRPLATPQGAAD
ncbi:MAG: hemolysin family protein [Actinomycetes bacterium]